MIANSFKKLLFSLPFRASSSQLLQLPSRSLTLRSSYQMAFFNNKISDKYGKKCCRYHQDGKPLSVDKCIQIQKSISEFIKGWQFNANHTRLIKYFFIEDYTLGVQFIKDIAKIDALNFQNCPSFSMQKGELLTIELYSPPLDGLSQLDFQMAMKINQMELDHYFLIPVDQPVDYKRQVQLHKMQKQNLEIQKQLEADAKAVEEKKQKEPQENMKGTCSKEEKCCNHDHKKDSHEKCEHTSHH